MSRLAPVALLCYFLILVVVQAVPEGRVVGGKNAFEGQFPHQVSVRMYGQHICGGSIISSIYVLTAGHCVGDKDENGVYTHNDAAIYSILAGTNNLQSGGVVRQVSLIKVHEGYGTSGVRNDVALLELDQPLTFSRHIMPIELASAEPPSGSPVTISGWGRLQTNGEAPNHLQWNVLVSKGHCFGWNEVVCLAHSKDNGACNGDSGGPAVFNGELVGVAGFVFRVCGSAYPDGYANVFLHVEWIKKNSDL